MSHEALIETLTKRIGEEIKDTLTVAIVAELMQELEQTKSKLRLAEIEKENLQRDNENMHKGLRSLDEELANLASELEAVGTFGKPRALIPRFLVERAKLVTRIKLRKALDAV